jgi:16S rRNA (guanine(966)-N(2))-methyltransferase RsmD
MRVVGGEAKGFELQAPKGSETRPTSDKVREAIFAVIGPVSGATMLDVYSGTGALAIEALSRGAERAELVESLPAACRTINQNLAATRMQDKARLWCMPVSRALPRLEGSFDLVTADPPYSDPGIDTLMQTLGSGTLLNPSATVVLEHSRRFDSLPEYGRLKRWQLKRYGDTAVSFYELDEERQ